MNTNEMLVCLRDITKVFDGKPVIEGLNLDIYHGEFLTLLGPSGCGKTTVLRILSGHESADCGQILLEKKDITNMPAEHRQVNTVFQSYALFPHMNVYDNIAFGLRMQKVSSQDIPTRVNKALELVRLPNLGHRYPHQLSGGQQQRIAIARAIVNEPKVLLLDESLSALDYKLRKQMQEELKILQRSLGITFVFVTHDQDEALSLSDRIVVLDDGKIIQQGSPRDIYETPKNLSVARFIGDINIMDGVLLEHQQDNQWQANVEGRRCLVGTEHKFQAGDRVCVLLRPEDLRITEIANDTESNSCLQGKIIGRTYRGATLDSTIQLESGKVLHASEFFDEDDPDFDYRIGQHVSVSWVDSWEVVLPYEFH